MHLEPPLITITNPNAPLGQGDVLTRGNDRPPWRPSRRPSRRQTVLTLVTVSVLALTSGAVAYVRHVQSEHAKDRAATADVDLVLVGDSGDSTVSSDSGGTVNVQVRNDGRFAVRLLSARADQPGFGVTLAAVELPAGETAAVTLSDDRTCSPALLSHVPQNVVVRAKTHRGAVVVRTLPIDPDTVGLLGDGVRERCGYVLPGEAFGLDVTRVASVGRDVVVDVQAQNTSVLPLTLEAFLPGGGVQVSVVSPRLPLQITPETDPNTAPQTIALTLRLHVTSCRLLSTPQVPTAPSGAVGFPVTPGLGLVRLHGSTSDTEIPLFLGVFGVSDGRSIPDPGQLLYKRACGITIANGFSAP